MRWAKELAHNHALHAGKIALFRCDFEVTVDDAIELLIMATWD
jgi:hypothetical protein